MPPDGCARLSRPSPACNGGRARSSGVGFRGGDAPSSGTIRPSNVDRWPAVSVWLWPCRTRTRHRVHAGARDPADLHRRSVDPRIVGVTLARFDASSATDLVVAMRLRLPTPDVTSDLLAGSAAVRRGGGVGVVRTIRRRKNKQTLRQGRGTKTPDH